MQASYVDNASYAEDGSVAKAKAFVTACRILLLKLPAEAGTRESHVRLNPAEISREKHDAEAWVQANDATGGGPRVTRGQFRELPVMRRSGKPGTVTECSSACSRPSR